MVAHCEELSIRLGPHKHPARLGAAVATDLDAHAVLEDGLGRVGGDLVVGLVPVLEAEVVVLDVKLEEREDKLVLDFVPAESRGIGVSTRAADRTTGRRRT